MNTLREKFIAALQARGERIIEQHGNATGKTVKMTRGGETHNNLFFFIGKAGSLRTGATKTGSIPCSDKYKQSLLGDVT